MGYVMTQEEKDFLKQYDISKFKDLYAITFGEPLIMVHEDKKPPVGKEKPWKS